MNGFVQVPSKGQPMTAQWGADVANGLNAIRSAGQAGMLLADGPTGTGFAPLPANMRARHGVSIPKPFDIETRKDEESGEAYRVIVRCAIANERLTVLDDWSDFPELGEGETATIFLRAEKQKKEEIDDIPETNYSIVAKVDDEEGEVDGDEEAAEDEGLVNHYPLYRINSSVKVLVDYRDAFIRPLSWHTDERSIGQDDYPDYPTVLSLSHFYDDERNMTLENVKAAAQLTRNCDLIVRIVANPNERQKVVYVPLLELLSLIKSGGGGGGGGGGDGGDPDNPDDPNPPSGDGVTSLNGVDGDLVLRLLEGWLEIVKGGQAKKAIGTVVTSVSGLYGDMAVIGGKKIRVDQEGNSLKISYDDEKETEDTNPFPDSPEVCEHPGGGGGAFASGGGCGGGVQGGGGESGGGDSCCGGASAAGGSATGMPEPGVSGKPATGGSGTNGKEITGPQTPEGGKEAGGGLFNGSTIPKKKIEDTNTHGSLTDTKKMTTSPFAKDPNWHGSIEDTAGNSKKPIYTGTHNALTDTKKMTESPFKRK